MSSSSAPSPSLDPANRRSRGPAALSRRPVLTLLVAALVTVLLGAAAGQQRTEPGLDAFTPAGPAAEAWDRVSSEFAASGATLVVVVETPAGATIDDSSAVLDAVRYAAAPLDGVVADGITDPRDPAGAALRSGPNGVADRGEVGLVVVPLDPSMGLDGQVDVARALDDRLGAIGDPSHSLTVVGDALISAEIDENAADELGRLALVALAVVIAVLAMTYRRFSDVAIGLVGIVVSLVWATGLTVVVGPDGLGLTGHQSAISVIVPVLIIGLGIDFGIHLTMRHREAQADGESPRTATAVAVGAVGGALVLAAITTMLGFLTNLASPLAPVRDLGVHTALGVAASLVASLLVVPPLRQLVGARTAHRPLVRRRRSATAGAESPGTAGPLDRIVGQVGRSAVRRPRATLALAAAIAAVAMVGASTLDTSFDERDFLPDGNRLSAAVDVLETAFGSDPGETSYLLLDGDLTDPDVLAALATVHDRLAGVHGVVVDGEDAVALSPWTLLADAGAAPTDVATITDTYRSLRASEPAAVSSVLAEDHRSGVIAVATSGTPAEAADLADGLEAAAEPLAAIGVEVIATSQDVVTASIHSSLADSQLRGLALTLGATALLLVGVNLRARRVLTGLASLLPAAFAAAATGGVMALAGYQLNVLTIMVSALAVGIGVPFGVHVTARFHRELDAGSETAQALERTVTHTGQAVVASALTTAAGFGALALSANEAIRQFGIITFVCVVAAAAATLTMQPAALALASRSPRCQESADEQAATPTPEHSEELAGASR